MRAILLAAGFGTRLRPVTDHTPKTLVPIDGRPLLDYWLHGLFANGIERVLINTHYLQDQVQNFVANSPFLDRIDLVHEETLLGTAGTIRSNKCFVANGPVLVAHADNLCICKFGDFIGAHKNRPSAARMTMMTFDAPDPTQCGVVKCDEAGLVQEFHEKVQNPPGRRSSAAVYIMEPDVVDFIAASDLPAPDLSNDIVPDYMGRIFAWQNAGYHMDIGTLETFGLAQIEIKQYQQIMSDEGWFDTPAN